LKPLDSPQQLILMQSCVFGLHASGGQFMIFAEPERSIDSLGQQFPALHLSVRSLSLGVIAANS
jgi:hypothetical protein